MRDARNINADLDDAKLRRSRTQGDLDSLLRGRAVEDLSSGELSKASRYEAGLERQDERITDLEQELAEISRHDRRQELMSRARDPRSQEPGDSRTARDPRRDRSDRAGDAIRSQALRHLDNLAAYDEVGRAVLDSRVGDAINAAIRRDDEQFDGSYIARRLLITESDAYRSAFHKYMRTSLRGQPLVLNASEADAYDQLDHLERSMSENTTTAGGFGLPVLVDPSIIVTSGAADVPLLRYCRVESITTNLWKGVSSSGMSWSYTTESSEASDNSPTLAQPSVYVHMARGYIPYSIEVSQDYGNFIGEISRLVDAGYQDLLAQKTMQGTGTNEPFGLFPALDATTFSEVVTTTDGQFGGADVFKIWAALPERYRGNASWVMSVAVQNSIRQFAASQSSTSAYFTIDLTAGTFRINDRPVILTDYAPTYAGSVPGTTGAANILAVGDLRQSYLFVQRAGMSLETVNHVLGSNRRPTGERAIFAWARNGANVVNSLGAKVLQNQ